MASLLAYDNRALGNGAFTAGTGTWSSSPAIDNLGNMQPQRYAEVTPASGDFDLTFQAQDSGGSPENFSPDVFALIGHTLPDSAVVTFKDGTTTLGSVTVSNAANRAQNAIVVTDSTANFDTLTVEVSSAGSSAVRLGCLWASESFRPDRGFSLTGYGLTPDTLAQWTRIDSSIWPVSRQVVNRVTFQTNVLTRSEYSGPSMPNWLGITALVGRSSPVILIPDDTNLHESTYGLFEAFAQARPERMPQASGWRAGGDVLEMR
jgi:hypothetical protein